MEERDGVGAQKSAFSKTRIISARVFGVSLNHDVLMSSAAYQRE
jgi:hypothetical protein